MAEDQNLILGAQSYLAMVDEVAWGTFPGSPQYYHIPVTDYSGRFQPVNRQANPFIGVFERMHSANYKGMPSGSLNVPLYGWHAPNMGMSIAQYFMDWAFGDIESILLSSKSIEWAEGPNIANKRHRGCRVNSATLSGSSDSGNITLALELMAQDEDGQGYGTPTMATAQTLPTNRYKLVDFEYANDTTFALGPTGAEIINPKSFTIQIQNGLKPEYLNGSRPLQMPRTQRVITMSVVIPKDSDVYDAAQVTNTPFEYIGNFTLQGLHEGTGTGGTSWSQVVINMPRCSFLKSDNQGSINDPTFAQLSFVVLKPQTSSSDLSMTWTDV